MTLTKSIIFAALLASPASAKTYDIPDDWRGGGQLRMYHREMLRLDQQGYEVRLIGGICLSACSLFLGARKVCTKDLTVEFHGPVNMVTNIIGVRGLSDAKFNRLVDDWATVLNRWPGLGDWYRDVGSKRHGLAVTKVSSEWLNVNFGVPICGENQ